MKKNENSKSKDRVRKYGEVFTPPWVVKKMCDYLEENSPGAFWVDKTFFEPACGTGNFLVEILLRKLAACKHEDDFLPALCSIFAIDLLPDNVAESRARMLSIFTAYCGKCYEEDAKEILETNIIRGDSLKLMKEMESAKESVTPSEWFKERRINGGKTDSI